jgi:hypothetical protein
MALKHGCKVKGMPLIQRHALARDVDKVPEYSRRAGVVQGRAVRGRGVCVEDVVVSRAGERPNAHPVYIVEWFQSSSYLDTKVVRIEMSRMRVGHRVIRVGHGGFIVRLPIIVLVRNRWVNPSIAALGRSQRLLWAGRRPMVPGKYGMLVSYTWATLETMHGRRRVSV